MADHSIQRPVPIEELDEHFKPRQALKETPIALERRFHVTAEREPQVKTRLQRIERGDGQPHWEVIVDIDGVRAGGRALPSALRGRASKIEKRRVSEDQLAQHLTSYVPDHLGFNAIPQEQLKSVKRIRLAIPNHASLQPYSAPTTAAPSRTRPIRGQPSGWFRQTAVPVQE